MTIAEMHINFRQYAQQMGMQNVRAILPEQIDMLINQSITDTVNQLIRENIGITNDRVVTDNSKIGQINAFRTLYDVKEVLIDFNPIGHTETYVFEYNPSDRRSGKILHKGTIEANTEDIVFGNYMFFVDMSIKYSMLEDGSLVYTNWYPVRIIDDAYLSDTLNDFVLKNRFRSPVGVIYNNNTLELYIDKFEEGTAPKISVSGKNNSIELSPYKLRISTIQKPSIVKYVEDISESESVDCNLPDSMHGDIVKHAVDLYRIAVSGSLHANQEAEQAQQRENVRNNYRNEGNNQ